MVNENSFRGPKNLNEDRDVNKLCHHSPLHVWRRLWKLDSPSFHILDLEAVILTASKNVGAVGSIALTKKAHHCLARCLFELGKLPDSPLHVGVSNCCSPVSLATHMRFLK